jgi:transposase-like protein
VTDSVTDGSKEGTAGVEGIGGAFSVDAEKVRSHLDEVVRGTVEQTLNALLDADGFREVLGVAEGTKEDAASWRNFLRHLKERGLTGVRLFVSDKCLGLVAWHA